MSFTWQGTYFFNGQSFDEIEHAKALNAGIVNFIGEGFDFENGNITRGHGINNGVPFVVGRTGELQDVTPNFTGVIVVETTLSGSNSNTRIVEVQTVPESSNTVKYFKIYDFEEGLPIKDYRHVEYIKEFRVEKTGTNTFKFILNGYPSDEFTFPESGVMSINGEFPVNGNVTLTANEVGALSELSIEIPDGADLNDYQSVGFYSSRLSANTIANAPIEGVAFSLLVEQTTADGWKQTWTSYRTDSQPNIYVRTSYNESWGVWDRLLTEAGGEVTGNLTIPHATNIRGTGTGSGNTALLEFMESDNVTRRGYIGDSSGSNEGFVVVSEKGDLNLTVTTGNKVLITGYEAWHKGELSPALINNVMIGYDDAIHSDTPLNEILKELFDKSQDLVGIKPFELTFLIGNSSAYQINLYQKIIDFIAGEYGDVFTVAEYFTFKIEATTSNGTSESYVSANKCSVWGRNFYFEWEFDYDNWANVIVRDARGEISPYRSREKLLKSEYIGMYMNSGQNRDISIPSNIHITKIVFTFSDYDYTSQSMATSQFNTHVMAEGKIYGKSSSGTVTTYDSMESGAYDASLTYSVYDGSTQTTAPETGVIIKAWNVLVNYSLDQVQLVGITYPYPAGSNESDSVLNSVNIYGYYL